MADNKKNRGKPDSYLISFKQKYEFDYAARQLQKKFPDKNKTEIKEALTDAAKEIDPSRGRKRIMDQASKNLKKRDK